MAKTKPIKIIDPDSPKGRVEKLAGLLERYLNKNILITFGKHSSPAQLLEVKLATQNDMVNKPNKRIKDDKQYTPACVLLTFEGFSLLIILEDIQNTKLLTNGIDIFIEDCPTLEIREV